ncbi:hypothetical protein L2E82_50856 [Cichorium intybus]|nr:hypothetical protein L2E82_50856 [Cichorium intybus]
MLTQLDTKINDKGGPTREKGGLTSHRVGSKEGTMSMASHPLDTNGRLFLLQRVMWQEHRPYHGPDTDNYHPLYCREAPPIYCDNIYPDQMMEYHHQSPRVAMLPPRYHLPQPKEYHHI